MSIFDFCILKEKEKKLKKSIEQLENSKKILQVQINNLANDRSELSDENNKIIIQKNIKNSIEQLENDKNVLQEQINNLLNNKNELNEEIKELEIKKEKITNQLIRRQDFYVETELSHIDNLSGLEFENYCTELLKKNGYKSETTKATGDDGGDIIAVKDNITYIIQCKKYLDTVGNRAVQEVYAAKGIYKAQKAIVITNNFFTNHAIKEADMLDVELWDRNSMKLLLKTGYDFIVTNIDNESDKENTDIFVLDRELDEASDDDTDELLMDAMEVVVETGQASTSFIQRKFNIGYARAGRIIDQLEERGVISGYQGSKPRQVLMTKERLEELKKSASFN